MFGMPRLSSLAVVFGLTAVVVSAAPRSSQPAPQQGVAAVDFAALGPPPGTPAPDLRLRDQDDIEQTLASLAGPRGTMLVFFRSADW